MTRGRKPKPTAVRLMDGNPGKRGYNANEPVPPVGCPECPGHLSDAARREWHRMAATLHDMGVLTTVDRAAFAAYCQAYGRWVEAEERLKETPLLLKTPSGYVQQSPWLSVSNKQLELMGRFMAELGLTPASRSRLTLPEMNDNRPIITIARFIVSTDKDGNRIEERMDPPDPRTLTADAQPNNRPEIIIDDRL